MVVRKNNRREIQLFGGQPTQGGFNAISLIGPSNGLVSGKPTRKGFGEITRGFRRVGNFFVSPAKKVVRRKARKFIAKKAEQAFEKPKPMPTTEELLEQEQKEILKKLKKKKSEKKRAKEIE